MNKIGLRPQGEDFPRLPKDLEPEIKEGRDRKYSPAQEKMEKTEDEQQVDINNPRHRFKTEDDLIDESYISYGEKMEESEEIPEDNEEAEENIMPEPLSSITDYDIKEINPENEGLIGAASISGAEKTILINREAGEIKSESNIIDVKEEESLIRQALSEKYENPEDEIMPSSKIRAASYKDYGFDSKIELRRNAYGESHKGDNLATMPDKKKQKSFRGLLRNLIKG